MKLEYRILVIVFLLCISKVSYGQFISESKVWKTAYSEYENYDVARTITKSYFFEGDTIIAGTAYSKLNYYTDSIRTSDSEIFFETGIRAEGSKIYNSPSPLNNLNGTLLYDFEMQVGDTLFSGQNDVDIPIYTVVNVIDSMLVQGEFKKLYLINSGEVYLGDTTEYHYRSVLEDYGDLDNAPFFPHCLQIINDECLHEILCISNTGEVIYENPKFDYCFIDFNVSVLEHDNQIKIFPNPVQSKLNLESSHHFDSNTIVTINDLFGRQLIHTKFHGNHNSISVEGLSKGIYFLGIEIDGRIESYKFEKL